MYLPKSFHETRIEVLHALMRDYPLATLIVHGEDGLVANHVPLALAGAASLHGHVARGNELAKADGVPVLAIFHGADGYVSPNWYPSKHETGREVPTWNYAVVHVHGRLRVVEDRAWLRQLLEQLTDRHEASQPKPWHVSDAPEDHIEKMLRLIVGIEIVIERIEGKFKLSQNHPDANRTGVLKGLAERDGKRDAELTELMQQSEERRHGR
ncbi:MAG TPA: FMN-binding negative transcriptional regulator [Dyella sp.]|uniref:FMN-binding negative transcriptional regulator n=1 Tax=Dyella sp. TaxID=1869338 RepID=UPI002C70F8E7|nr:FMN-binding negative transcriptional regulator [Dyella sp.]HUB88939.1 FMN-binding negative transcriptional regulator [Dyella sp.]